MDVLSFLKKGNVTVNPEYNPNTKKGRLQPPTLVNYKPGESTVDLATSNLSNTLTRNIYNLNQYDIDKYADYDVYVNPVDSQEVLDKERAVNQGHWEQGLRAIGQAANEVVLGGAVGFADLADSMVTGIDYLNSKINGTEFHNDYQSEVTKALEEVKESINERLAIYRENPNKAWDVSDFAWWTSNAPSIASSLSLLIPSTALSKGLSFAGKALRFNKMANKIANGLKMSEKAKSITSKIADSATIGGTSRLLENYMEARQTYNDVTDYANNQFASMTDKQRKEFFDNNPQYVGKSDEEIVRDIAENSANTTFTEDWANVLFDIYQVYNLKNLWKNALQGAETAGLRRVNTTAAKMFGQEGKAVTDAIASSGLQGTIKTKLKDIGGDILKGVRTEWSEGVEEAINYIASKDGMYMAQKVFDKDTPAPTLANYLKDPMLWEQAFWGALGGIAFSTIGDSAIGLAQRKLNKEWTSAEKQKENEILGRAITFSQYQEQLNLIKNGKNPFVIVGTKENQTNADIIAGQEEELKAVAEKQYIDNLIINAMNAGNISLLESYINDENFTKGIESSLKLQAGEGLAIRQRFNERLNSVKDLYNDTMNKASKLGANFEVAKIIATNYVRSKNLIDTQRNVAKWANDKLNEDLNKDGVRNTIPAGQEIQVRNAIYKYLIDDINSQINNISNNAAIDENTRESRIKDLEERKRAIQSKYVVVEGLENTNSQAADDLAKKHPEVYNDIVNSVNNEIEVSVLENDLDLTKPTLKRKITELNNIFDSSRAKIVNNAMKDIASIYKKYGKVEVEKYRKGEESALSKEDAKTIDSAITALELSKDGNESLNRRINNIANVAEIERRAEQNKNTNDTNNDENVEVEEESQTSSTGSSDNQQQPATPQQKPQEPQTQPNNTTIQPETKSQQTTRGSSTEGQPTPPPVEDGNNEQTATKPAEQQAEQPATPQQTINIPDDTNERYALLDELVTDYIANNLDIDNITVEQLRTAKAAFIEQMKTLGFEESEASNVYDNFAAMLFPDIMYSKALDSTVNRMLINAGYAILTKNNANIEAILEDFAKSKDSNGNTRGRMLNGVTYLSIGGLIDYLTEASSNKLVHEFLFETIKAYLYDQTRNNGKFRATDETTISSMTNSQFTSYVDSITQARYDFARQKYTNKINIHGLANDVVGFKALTTLKIGDELTYEVDKAKNRILIKDKNNNVIGYMGIPTTNSADGTYNTVNQGWKYSIHIDDNGLVQSSLREEFIDIFTNPDHDERFMAALYDAVFRYIINPDIIKNDGTLNNLRSLFEEIHPNLLEYLEDSKDKTTPMLHLIELTKYVIKNEGFATHEASINRWFDNLAKSYAQAENILDGKLKGKIVVGSVTYGVPNTEQEQNYEGNNILETVINYNENTNQLGIVISDDRQVQFANSNKPIVVNPNDVVRKGQIVMQLPSPDGYVHNVFCRQSNLSDKANGKNISNLVSAAKDHIYNIITDFFDGKITFDELGNSLTQLINIDNGLFTGFDISYVPGRSIAFKVKDKVFDDSNFAITINNSNNKFKANMIVRREDIKDDNHLVSKKNDAYGIIGNRKINKSEVKSLLSPIVDKLFNNYGKIAVGISNINDKLYKERDNNKYIKRIKNKTVIAIGDVSYSYKSYQDFLVKENVVRTKLRNTNEKGTSGNWKFTDTSRFEIEYQTEEEVAPTSVGTINSDHILDRTLGINEVEVFSSSFTGSGSVQSFDAYFKTLDSYSTDKNEAINYIKELQDIGILPSNIEVVDNIKDNTGQEVNALYMRKADKIKISKKAFDGMTIDRAIRVVIHESLHQQLNNVYDRKDALNKVKPIYDKFEEWVNNQDEETKAKLGQFLFKTNKGNTTDVSLEEFLVESITNNTLMNALNSIKLDNIETNTKENLFTKLIRVISEILGIVIDENSLLAAARNVYVDIANKGDSKAVATPRRGRSRQNANVQTTIPFTASDNNSNAAEKIDSVNNNPNDTPTVTEEDNSIIDDMGFSSVPDMTTRTIYSLSDQIPLAIRSNFDSLLADGTISYHC